MSKPLTENKSKLPVVISPLRVWTIAMATFTQLVRMKTFWFLLLFALVIAGFSTIDLKTSVATAQMSAVKKVSFGAMDLFAWLYAITATAILIPKDIEDRTLYTILTKPVNRLEYLIGKLLGVLVTIGISLVIMFVICMLVLFIKQQSVLAEQVQILQSNSNLTVEDRLAQVKLIKDEGVRPVLLLALLSSFLKASVVAALAILISTFASSSLFTIIVSFALYLIGFSQGMLINHWIHASDGSGVVKFFSNFFKVLVPDIQMYSFGEKIVSDAVFEPNLVWGMIALTAFHLTIYIIISLIIFIKKEF